MKETVMGVNGNETNQGGRKQSPIILPKRQDGSMVINYGDEDALDIASSLSTVSTPMLQKIDCRSMQDQPTEVFSRLKSIDSENEKKLDPDDAISFLSNISSSSKFIDAIATRGARKTNSQKPSKEIESLVQEMKLTNICYVDDLGSRKSRSERTELIQTSFSKNDDSIESQNGQYQRFVQRRKPSLLSIKTIEIGNEVADLTPCENESIIQGSPWWKGAKNEQTSTICGENIELQEMICSDESSSTTTKTQHEKSSGAMNVSNKSKGEDKLTKGWSNKIKKISFIQLDNWEFDRHATVKIENEKVAANNLNVRRGKRTYWWSRCKSSLLVPARHSEQETTNNSVKELSKEDRKVASLNLKSSNNNFDDSSTHLDLWMVDRKDIMLLRKKKKCASNCFTIFLCQSKHYS